MYMNRIANKTIAIIFAVYIMVGTAPVFAQSCIEYYKGNRRLSVTNEDRIYAVHITKFLPTDGFIRIVTKDRPRFLPTIHFSLGEPVVDHFAGKWSEKPFAIVTPMKSLRDQMLNLYPQDTYILGDFKLPADAILFVPRGTQVPENLPFKVIEYESPHKVKDAVSQFLDSSGTIQFKTTEVARSMKTYLGKLNIMENENLDKFFSSLIKEKPHLTRTLHDSTIWGELDNIIIARLFNWVSGTSKYSESKYQERNLELDIDVLSDRISEITKLSNQLNLPAHAIKSFKESLAELQSYKILLEVEKYAREFGKSFLNMEPKDSPELHALILSARYSREKLMGILKENKNKLAEAPIEVLQYTLSEYYGVLRHKSLKEFSDFLNEKYKDADAQTKREVRSAIVKRVFKHLQEGSMRAEDAYPFFLEYKDALKKWDIIIGIGNDLYSVAGYKDRTGTPKYPHREFVRFLKYEKVHEALKSLGAFEHFNAEQVQTYENARQAITALKEK